tara:strand:+ start:392 stop:2416 length:2025 start_codon:yes stop_codon:yes gene_type:complete
MAEDNTPTNVLDVGNVHDNPNYKVSLNVDNNGNVIIYRSTNTPDRFLDTDFSKFDINKTIGEQTYFASNPEFAQSFSQSGKRNIYSFSTNIKPEEILHLQSNIYENKELLNKLGGQEYINNIVNERGINNYRFNSLDNIPKSLTWSELYYSTNKGRTDGSKEILQREIVQLQNNGVKAIGVSPVNGAKNEYNILPIINEQSQLDIVAKGLIDKNLKETPIDTPTNVVDEVVIGIDRSGIEVTIPIDKNGNVQLFRATDNPERFVIFDFTSKSNIQSAGLGTQNYFATNAPYAHKYTGTNKKLYKFSTNIKPNEILDISPVSLKNKHPELYTLIFGENEIRNTKAIQDNIETIKELGYKAIGNRETGSTGLVKVAQYEIIPLTTANETYNIKPIATLETKEGFAAGKSPEAFIETPIDTPTNVVDDVTPASVVDEAVEYIDNLNIDNAIKKEVKDKIVKVTGQASGAISIPGVGQVIDFWEAAVLVVGAAALAAGEIDELPKVIYNFGLDLYESILSGYNIPFQPAKRKEYNPNFERISSGLTWIDKLQPTSYVINPVIEEFQEIAETTPTMEVPGFGTVPYSEYYQPPVQSTPEKDNINIIMTNLMTSISNAQRAYPRTRKEIELFGRNPIQVVTQDTADKPEKVEYDSKEKQNLHDIYAELYKNLSNASARIQ